MDQTLANLQCSVVDKVGAFAALQGEWDALHSASPDGYVSQGFEWARICLEKVAREGRAPWRCFILRRHGRMVAVLAMVAQTGRFCRLAKPLAAPSNEYCPLLLAPSLDVAAAWRSVRAELRRWHEVDAVQLSHVRDDSALTPWLRSCPQATRSHSLAAPFLRRSEFESWESYRDQLPHKVRSNLDRNWRRLRRQGEVTFGALTDRAEVRAAWEWMIEQKRAWLARKGLESPFIPSDDYFRFVDATLEVSGLAGRRSILALKLDGQLVAAELANIDRRRVEMFILTYDPAWSQYAPGNLLRGEVLRWAFAQGLDYDWRIGDGAYKSEWATHTCEAASYVVALNMKGRAFAAYVAGRRWLAERASKDLRARVRSLVDRT